jgi:hypothetical protein
MAQSDCAAGDVDPLGIDAEVMHDSQRLCGEGLVQFKKINVLYLKPGSFQGWRHGSRRPDTHERGVDTNGCVAHNLRKRRQPVRAHNPGYGPDYNVRPLRFVLSAYYSLPSPAKSHAFLANTLGGWTLATATVVQDGQQSSITFNNIYNAYGITSDRASYAPGCSASHVATKGSISSRVNNYINTACFQGPPVIGADGVATDFGNTPNGILREPDQADVDLTLSKTR